MQQKINFCSAQLKIWSYRVGFDKKLINLAFQPFPISFKGMATIWNLKKSWKNQNFEGFLTAIFFMTILSQNPKMHLLDILVGHLWCEFEDAGMIHGREIVGMRNAVFSCVLCNFWFLDLAITIFTIPSTDLAWILLRMV